ncbi:hypothetical protein [Streptomyces sp. NPDC000410]|uniref:hypothetical protein n=1 Tax=Streptomyces sp. NPDC000410 TaxID=3154254 RepID=UPI003320FD3F
MRRFATLATLTAILLSASACTTDKNADEEATPDDSTCKELLGESGLNWLEDRTGGKARLKVKEDLKSARALFYRQVENEYPEASKYPMFRKATVCRSRTGATNPQKELEIRVGPSFFPFDTDFDETSRSGEKTIETPVNSDVKLVLGKDWDRSTTLYRVYVTCKIPGTPAQQANEIPIEGTMTDTLTGETSLRVHYTHLLQSAKVMADNFGCENKPVVPAEPPASVK